MPAWVRGWMPLRVPGLWTLILRDAMRLWSVMVLGAVGFMLVVQMHEIARFAALSPEPLLILRFLGYQLPYILPNAMPLAALLAAYVTFRRMSLDGELTSLRAGGCSLAQLLVPLMLFAASLGLLNLGVASELAPRCRSQAKQLLDQVAGANPLALVHQKRLLRLADTYVSAEPDGHNAASDFWMALPVGDAHQLALLHAERLELDANRLSARDFLVVLPRLDSVDSAQDQLWVQQAASLDTEATGLSPFLLRSTLQRAEDYLGWSSQWQLALAGDPLAQHELLRRLVLALAPLGMVPLGAAFGMTTARHPRRLDLVLPLVLALLILGGFMAGKSLPHKPLLSLFLFFGPLMLCAGATAWRLRLLHEGRAC
jgi:lipopolysaccharide export system permease protein